MSTDGPVDRFSQTKVKNAQKRELVRDETAAEKRAASGKEFICRQCRIWHLASEYEYVYNGETKMATRCYTCRWYRRQKGW